MRCYHLFALIAPFTLGCATTLDNVRPVLPPTAPRAQMVWPNYVPAKEVALLDAAERRIATERKGELLIHIVGSDGLPVNNVDIAWAQQRGEVRFGVHAAYEPNVWGQLIRAGVDQGAATLDWSATQPTEENWSTLALRAHWGLDILPAMGVETRGSAAVWMVKDSIPDWVQRLNGPELIKAVESHVLGLATRLKGKVTIWEAMRDPNARWADAVGEDPDLMLDLARAASDAIRHVDSAAPIVISYANPIGEAHNLSPAAFSKRLVDAEVDFDVIGLQYFYNGYREDGSLFPRRTLPELAQNLEDLAAFGKELHVTGVSAPSENHPELAGYTGAWGVPWSEETQATWLRAVYTLAFANPAVTAMVWRDALDADALLYKGGLFKKAGVPKAAFWSLKDLISSWQTDGKGHADETGQLRVRGFAGNYRITVTDPITERSVIVPARIKSNELRSLEVILPPELTHRNGRRVPWTVVKRTDIQG